jgi:hypothetical protein
MTDWSSKVREHIVIDNQGWGMLTRQPFPQVLRKNRIEAVAAMDSVPKDNGNAFVPIPGNLSPRCLPIDRPSCRKRMYSQLV